MIKRILYIEDNYYNILLVKKILEKEGFSFYEAKDGISGIELAKRIKPDLILMDINLPDLSGLEVTTRIRSIPELQNVKIIALTADISEGSREKSLVAGCDGFISKPINKNFINQLFKYLTGEKDEIGDKDEQIKYLKEYSISLVEKLENKIKELTKANEELEKSYKVLQNINKKLLYLNKMEENFISISSHELRTPIVVLKGFIDLAVDGSFGEISPKLSEILKICQNNIDKLISIVEDITDFARLRTSNIKINVNEINIEEFLSTIAKEYKSIFESRNLKFSYIINSSTKIIYADKELLFQAIHNYISNAIRNTPDFGEIILGFEENDNEYIFYVKDTGIGIEQQYLEKIFEKFFVIREATHHFSGNFEFMAGGKGLGLAIVKNIAKIHEGKSWAVSEGLGKGSTFYLTISKNFKKIAGQVSIQVSEKRLIYIINYKENIKPYISSIFEELFFDYDYFKSNIDNLESPLFVLMDISEINFEDIKLTINKIKSNLNYSDVPIIVVDKEENILKKGELFSLGVEEYLIKPIDKNKINSIISSLI
ncbi:MAG: response regulator [Spirochaetes bacterium]|nr:response regulator [Spirochaetota bacterium]